MTDFSLRPYTNSAATQVVDLINAAAWATIGIRRAVVDGVGNIRLNRYVPAESEKVVAVDPQATIVGYAYFTSAEQAIIHETGGAVHPAYWRQGIGTLLLNWAEEQATATSQHAPAGVKTVLQSNLFASEAAAIQLFTDRGFSQVREWIHLVVELTAPPPLPVLPKGLLIRPMDLENDWELIEPTMDAAFANHWGAITLPVDEQVATEPEEEAELPTDDSYSNAPGFCFIALDGITVVGGVLCNAKLVERTDSGRVGSLFVHPAYQRQGIGRALMHMAFGAFWQAGVRRIILDTDAASFSATPRFYASLGMNVYRRELLYEKVIRPGREVRRLTL